MDPAKLLKYDQRVPRYTSYPTAVQFDPSVGPEQHGRWLQRVGPEQSVSVYLHVPFCNELCWYCGCNTQVGRHDSTFGNYTDLLCREIDMAAEFFSSRPKVTWVHWGGGTPSSIGVDRMARIMAAVQRHCDLLDGAEVAVELDPRVLSLDELARLPRELGVNRASIGVQDFNPRVQAAINRTQPYDLVAAVVARIREEGIADLNLDLMYGLPHQRREDFGDTVDQAITLRPERMTLFGYAHVPWMFSHQNLIKEADLPDGDERLALFDEALRRLDAAG
ncbi:MAG: radical SAM protein, partial [Alphaproteobacteria bacterium]|nr:radical SAM protein [Alphaproteobacteria bacterium]